MQLLLMRHADTQSGASYAQDELRPLTDHGRSVQATLAKFLHSRGIMADYILHSPRLRALQTAEIVAQGLQFPNQLIESQVLDGGFSVESLLTELEKYAAKPVVICVGHEPDMGIWAGHLLSVSPINIDFKKSSVMGLSFMGAPKLGRATLQFFYRGSDFSPD